MNRLRRRSATDSHGGPSYVAAGARGYPSSAHQPVVDAEWKLAGKLLISSWRMPRLRPAHMPSPPSAALSTTSARLQTRRSSASKGLNVFIGENSTGKSHANEGPTYSNAGDHGAMARKAKSDVFAGRALEAKARPPYFRPDDNAVSAVWYAPAGFLNLRARGPGAAPESFALVLVGLRRPRRGRGHGVGGIRLRGKAFAGSTRG